MISRFQRFLQKRADRQATQRALEALGPSVSALIGRIRDEHLTYLPARRLACIAAACQAAERSGRAGLFLEAGCALGGSSILIASLKSPQRPFRVHDVFGMIPPPTAQDTPDVHARYRTIVEGKSKGLGGGRYYGYEPDLIEVVRGNFRRFGIEPQASGVSLVQGLVQDTLEVDAPVAFAHIDVDWYEPVMTCLERIFPRLLPGACLVLDDYHDWGGCRKATDEYLLRVPGQFQLDDTAGSMTLTRLS